MRRSIPVTQQLCLTLMLAIVGCFFLPVNHSANAGWNVVGQPAPGRVDDGAVFTALIPQPSPNPPVPLNFAVDSSLVNNKWWTSNNRGQPWNGVVTSPTGNPPVTATAGHFAMRVDEAIPSGGSFYFGLSTENVVNGLTFDFRVIGGADGSSQLPAGTMIYLGFSNQGSPSGVTHNQHTINSGAPLGQASSPRNSNATPIIPASSPPAAAFPAALAGSYSWVQYQRPTGLSGTTTSVMGMELRRSPQASSTEVVFVIVLPAGQGIALQPNTDNRLHFSWTIDGAAANPLGPLNSNFPNILVPEPGRAMLLGLAFALLLLRRSRPR